MKWLLRLLGGCGHEWKWGDPEFRPVINSDTEESKDRRVQFGFCERCGKMRIRPVTVEPTR